MSIIAKEVTAQPSYEPNGYLVFPAEESAKTYKSLGEALSNAKSICLRTGNDVRVYKLVKEYTLVAEPQVVETYSVE